LINVFLGKSREKYEIAACRAGPAVVLVHPGYGNGEYMYEEKELRTERKTLFEGGVRIEAF
jgi:hypothetical protein